MEITMVELGKFLVRLPDNFGAESPETFGCPIQTLICHAQDTKLLDFNANAMEVPLLIGSAISAAMELFLGSETNSVRHIQTFPILDK